MKLSAKDIIREPAVLTAPANSLKFRYMILRQVATKEEILSRPNWFMLNHKKTFARLMGLSGREVKLSHLLCNESIFQKQFGMLPKDFAKN